MKKTSKISAALANLHLQARIDDLKADAKKYGGELHLDIKDIRDLHHLNVLWYGGDVAAMDYRGITVCIAALGEVRVNGAVRGVEFECTDKWCEGRAYQDLALEHNVDDNTLRRMTENDVGKNWIYYENNNWFQWDIVVNGFSIDCFDIDNVVSDDILDACNPTAIATWVDANWDWIQDRLKENKAV